MLDRRTHDAQSEEIRRSVIHLIHSAGGGHFGGSLSVVDILLVLLRDCLYVGVDGHRDRFILSKGHAAPALYCTLACLGLMPMDALDGFGGDPAKLASHPELGRPPLCDFSTGSLGQGLSAALGMALALRKEQRRAWVVLGDGECQEGQVWEAAMLAARLQASNLVAVVDCNGFQEWGYRDEPRLPVLDLAAKWRAFGWRLLEVDGHDALALRGAFSETCPPGREAPTVVLARTVKGRGVPLMLSDPDRFHCTSLSEAEYAACLS